ncbi:glycosyl transferase family 2 [Flavobacterium sp. 270]|uniref:glycosyltransferase family A protein n=1 Tax=Flavobacterium sp. 270 TaxID=2512114 RepID=UPI001064CAF1|nr:glycosyltransferase family A protein [Flavobacterium sp. 270]TDW47152.1 glycosyl transferase family 2 [Flavobacterium sp. 270]
MRVGFNPNKDKLQEKNDFFHQVVVPVYIPNHEGYFKDSFKILQYCMESLFKTCHPKTYITVVNNGSCIEVINYLGDLYREGKIQEQIHTSAIGKLNAVLKGLAGHNFDLITISDADVLFLNNWQKETYTVFENFKKAGVVSPVPSSKMLKQFTENIYLDNFFSNRLKFTNTINKESLKMFATSIGNTDFYKDIHLNKNLTISNNGASAVVGAGHFIATYKGKCFDDIKNRFSCFSLGGDSEKILLDKPAEDKGYWRLSTPGNYAYHMGNVFEDWMLEIFFEIEKNKAEIKIPNNLINKPNTYLRPFARFFFRIISQKKIWLLFLRYKGLSKEEANQY